MHETLLHCQNARDKKYSDAEIGIFWNNLVNTMAAWCPGSLRRQDTSNNGIDYEG